MSDKSDKSGGENLRKCVSWDDLELELLKAYYPSLSLQDLLALLPNRTYQAIQRMASTLSIKRGNKGYKNTKQARERMSLAHSGHKLSAQHKLRLRRAKELRESMPPSVIFYKKSYLFMLSDHRAVKAIKLLYSDCTIALERKLQKALEIMEEFQ